MSLFPVDDENVDAMERRDRHDDPEEVVVEELAVLVDIKDEAVELRPVLMSSLFSEGNGR